MANGGQTISVKMAKNDDNERLLWPESCGCWGRGPSAPVGQQLAAGSGHRRPPKSCRLNLFGRRKRSVEKLGGQPCGTRGQWPIIVSRDGHFLHGSMDRHPATDVSGIRRLIATPLLLDSARLKRPQQPPPPSWNIRRSITPPLHSFISANSSFSALSKVNKINPPGQQSRLDDDRDPLAD